jgi:hypothetical protein
MMASPFISFSQTEDAYKPPYAVTLDESNGKVMMKQCSRGTPKTKKFWTVTKADTDSLEQHFNKLLGLNSSDRDRIINLRDFGFQYLGVTIGKKKYIYVNAFKLSPEKSVEDLYGSWKTFPVIVCDGGAGYWGALFDIESKQFSDVKFNGRL